MAELASKDERRDEVLDDVPGGCRGLRRVEGIGVGDALSPSAEAAALQVHEQERPIVDAPEARLEKADQRQSDDAKLHALDSHGVHAIATTAARRFTAVRSSARNTASPCLSNGSAARDQPPSP